MFIIAESPSVVSVPTKLKSTDKNGRVRMECILQTCDEINRNKRKYSRALLDEGLNSIKKRVQEGSFIGELDHPIDQNPVRQVTVLYKDCSHRILETGWSSNKLMATIETLRTPNGYILKNLAEDGVPVGFSFRGMGDVKQINEGSDVVYEVQHPLHVVTWDSVSYPSHDSARMIKITETVTRTIHESVGLMECVSEKGGLVCLKNGVCMIPNQYDKLVETRMKDLKNKYSL